MTKNLDGIYNENNKETKKLYIILGVALIAVAFMFIASVTSKKGIEYVEKVEKAFSSEGATVLYLARPTCSYCTLMTPIMESLSEEYGFDYDYINTDEITEGQLSDILEKIDKTTNEFGTPDIVVVENGTVIAEQEGYTDEESMFHFFQNAGIISSESTYVAPVNYLTYEEYEQKINSSEKQLFVVVQTGCSHCENVKPVFKQIKEEYGFTIDAINVSELSNDERESFLSSLSYYSEESWGTPLMLVVQNGEVVAEKSGADYKAGYVDFLTENGFLVK